MIRIIRVYITILETHTMKFVVFEENEIRILALRARTHSNTNTKLALRARTQPDTSVVLESKSEPESFNSLILSIAHFAWSAAPVLRLDETTVRLSSFEKILHADNNSNNNNKEYNKNQPNPSSEFADIFLTRLVCKPHTLPRFQSPVLFHMGLDRSFWQPRIVKTIKMWFRKHRIVQEMLSARQVLTSYVPFHPQDVTTQSKHRLSHAELRIKLKHAGWTIREKQQSHFIYIYDDATFTSLSDAARYHIDHVGTTDQDFYFKIGEEDEEKDEEESSSLACRFQCGFRVHETNKHVLEAHEMFCRVARVRICSSSSYLP